MKQNLLICSHNRLALLWSLCAAILVLGGPLRAATDTTRTDQSTPEAILYTFHNTDGRDPQGTLIQGKDGAYYGATYAGGVHTQGTLFKITSAGQITTLHNFGDTGDNLDGIYPSGGLVMDSQGVLYGVTLYGGANSRGTVFSYDPTANVYTVIYAFDMIGGPNIPTNVTLAGNALYGVSQAGGQFNQGTIFKLALPTKTALLKGSMLHSFHNNGLDGFNPWGALLYAQDKKLYGTTVYGGQYGNGTIFRLSANGSGYTVLHNFNVTNSSAVSDGVNPYAGLVQGADGTFYGATESYASDAVYKLSYGILFSFQPTTGVLTVLHRFNYSTDGAFPYYPVTIGTDGKLYGTTSDGGPAGGGTAFQLNTDGSNFNLLHAFDASSAVDGSHSYAGLVEGSDGNLMGLTSNGGIASAPVVGVTPNAVIAPTGAVFQLQTELPLATGFSPASGSLKAGTLVSLAGVNLAGATVTIGGVVQNVTSTTAIQVLFKTTATTPLGKYPIVVTTANGSFTTSKLFTVKP